VAEVLQKPYDCRPKSAPYLVQISGPVSNTSRVIVYFVYMFPNFRYYDNKG